MSERRIDPRADEVEEVILTTQSTPQYPKLENYSVSCLMTDLSVSGVRLDTYRTPPKGAIVEVMIRLRRPLRVFRLLGQVLWVRNKAEEEGLFSVGILFLADENERTKEWEDVVEKLVTHHT